jgi:hypothetical protein
LQKYIQELHGLIGEKRFGLIDKLLHFISGLKNYNDKNQEI